MESLSLELWTRAAQRLRDVFAAEESRLCGLDGAVGDGDHGTSMLRGFSAARQSLDESPAADIGELLRRIGETFLAEVGGVTGVVFGSLFLAAGQSAAGRSQLGTLELHAMMAAGLAAVVKRGSVKKGDKSMVDALAPAVAALETAAAEHRAAGEALNLAARAAAEGAEATRTLIARVGRARYQGDRAVGHVDAGAASVALLFETLAQEAQERGEGSQRA